MSSGQCEYESCIGEIGDSWSDDYRHYAQLGTPQELTIWGRGVSAHPIHVHVTLMQFISHVYYPNGVLKDMSSPFAEEGDWRDTWPALPGKSTLRMNFSNHTGEYVTHCHFLKHEDMGMMTTFFVDSATSSPSYSPTSKPTTRKPTVKPTTAKPTAKPSTAKPTVVPSTSKPSFTPSSATPSTAKPTMTPSTATPSTAIPTVAPSTAVPTEFPTLAPISGTKTIVTFSTSLSMSNVTVDDINNDEFKMTFKIAIMSALEAQDFPVSEVTNIKVESTALASHRGTLDSLYSSIESVWRTLYYFFIDEDSLQSSTSSLSYVNNNIVTSGSGGATVSYDILLVLENSIYTDPTSASAALTSILSSTSCITSVETDLNSGGYSVSSISSGTTTVTETTTITDDDGGEEATTLALWIIIVVIVVGVSVLLVMASIIRKIRSEGYKVRAKFELGSDHDMDEAVELAERQSVAVTYESAYSENNSSINSTMALTPVGTPTTQL